MPWYYFHIRHGDQIIEDEDGMSLSAVESARKEALQSARDLRLQASRDLKVSAESRVIEITDTDGQVVDHIALSGLAH
jgi:hypothetical protein